MWHTKGHVIMPISHHVVLTGKIVLCGKFWPSQTLRLEPLFLVDLRVDRKTNHCSSTKIHYTFHVIDTTGIYSYLWQICESKIAVFIKVSVIRFCLIKYLASTTIWMVTLISIIFHIQTFYIDLHTSDFQTYED